jgi:hypothetical protein
MNKIEHVIIEAVFFFVTLPAIIYFILGWL